MKRKKANQIIIGVVLLVIGIIWLGNALNFWHIDVLFRGWWAVLLMLCFLSSIIGDGVNPINVAGLLICGVIILKQNGLIPDSVNLWLLAFAAVLLVYGGKVLARAFRRRAEEVPPEEREN